MPSAAPTTPLRRPRESSPPPATRSRGAKKLFTFFSFSAHTLFCVAKAQVCPGRLLSFCVLPCQVTVQAFWGKRFGRKYTAHTHPRSLSTGCVCHERHPAIPPRNSRETQRLHSRMLQPAMCCHHTPWRRTAGAGSLLARPAGAQRASRKVAPAAVQPLLCCSAWMRGCSERRRWMQPWGTHPQPWPEARSAPAASGRICVPQPGTGQLGERGRPARLTNCGRPEKLTCSFAAGGDMCQHCVSTPATYLSRLNAAAHCMRMEDGPTGFFASARPFSTICWPRARGTGDWSSFASDSSCGT